MAAPVPLLPFAPLVGSGSAFSVKCISMSRPLTSAEEQLVRWMLEHGKPEARAFLSQLELALVTDWHCPCGCASINFSIQKNPEPSGGLNPVADFIFGGGEDLSGIFVYERSGILAGLEVYGLAGDAPKSLPLSDSLRPFENAKPFA
jgi:hypothetical protein